MSPLLPNFLLRSSIAGFKFFLDASIYGSDALFSLSTKLGSSANHIGDAKYCSNCNCFGKDNIFCFLVFALDVARKFID